MQIKTIQTGYTLVSPAVPDRSAKKSPIAYTGLFQSRKKRIKVPVKCFYVNGNGHSFLIDGGWSKEVVTHPVRHLGFGLYFASEPVMTEAEAAVNQLQGKPIDAILMTHLDCDHISGVYDFNDIPIWTSGPELEYAGRQKLRYGGLQKNLQFSTFPFHPDKDAPFGESYDVFGDGSVLAYLTPTHSAGSVLYKIVEGSQYALVVGDNGYRESSWMKGELPEPLYHAENMTKCLAWIKKCAEDPNCQGIFCAHDPVRRDL